MNIKPTLQDLLAQLVAMNEPCDDTLDSIKYRYFDVYERLVMAFSDGQSCIDAILPVYLNTLKTPVNPTILR